MKYPQKQAAISLAIALVSIAVMQFSPASPIKASSDPIARSGKWEQARLGDKVSILAAGRGNPWVNLRNGREVIAGYSGPSRALAGSSMLAEVFTGKPP